MFAVKLRSMQLFPDHSNLTNKIANQIQKLDAINPKDSNHKLDLLAKKKHLKKLLQAAKNYDHLAK